MLQFVINNGYLFVALGVILFLLAAGPISQQMYGIKNANAAQTVQLLNRENAVVVDVCEPKEFSAGHVPNAINLPLSSLPEGGGALAQARFPHGIQPYRRTAGVGAGQFAGGEVIMAKVVIYSSRL